MHQAKQVNPGWVGAPWRARVGRWCRRVAATACVAALSACGGGGSSSASSPAPIDPSRVVVSTLNTHDAANKPVVRVYSGLTIDPKTGDLYVATCDTNEILRVKQDGLVTLVAGSGVAGVADGDGTSAQFWCPSGLALAAPGVLYVADTRNNTIRKLVNTGGDTGKAADWTVTTIAGNPHGGYHDTDTAVPPELPTDAQFSSPADLVVDPSANALYVADADNNVIRKIDLSSPTGAVSTVAGSGLHGWLDGPNRTAQFFDPREIRRDIHGGFNVADLDGLRHVSSATDQGVVSTTRAAAGLSESYAQDSVGNFYRSAQWEGDADTVSLITPSGQVSLLAGTGRGHTDGTGDVAQFSELKRTVLDEPHKTLYVIESDPSVSTINDIRKIVLP